MRFWKAIAMVLCLGMFLSVFSGVSEAKGDKDMVKEKTAFITRCSYISAGSSTGGHERIELIRISDTEVNYASNYKDWHDSPERKVEKIVSGDVLKEMEALGREYKIFKWKPFRKSDLFAMDAASTSLSVSYKDPTNGAGWTLTMRSDDELNDKQSEYYHKLLNLLYETEDR
ncbi:MAG: hypothetical protein IJV46_03170 [Acidaminococcaceae bacterium]|nr:hypothetical protein [Acidaminococcaceae bacterium]